jgi:hypothetical protein
LRLDFPITNLGIRGRRTSECDEVNGHRQPDQCQKHRHQNGLFRGTKYAERSSVEFVNEMHVAPHRDHIDNHADQNQRGAEPQRKPRRWRGRRGLQRAKFLKEKPEARDHKAKSHQCQARANPGKERALGSEIVAQRGFGLRLRCGAHSSRVSG